MEGEEPKSQCLGTEPPEVPPLALGRKVTTEQASFTYIDEPVNKANGAVGHQDNCQESGEGAEPPSQQSKAELASQQSNISCEAKANPNQTNYGLKEEAIGGETTMAEEPGPNPCANVNIQGMASSELTEPLFIAVKAEPAFEELEEDGSDGEYMEEFFRGNSLQSYTKCSTWNYNSQNSTSSIQTIGTEMTAMNDPAGDASCSRADETMSRDEAADIFEGNITHQVAGGRTQQPGSFMVSMDEKLFKCSKCSEAFKKKESLKKHMCLHSGIRPYKCPQCGKSFMKIGYLSRHMKVHSGVRRYHCSECKMSFSEKRSLKKHMIIHTGQRPYKCLECGESFSRAATLTVHKRIHSGSRPYMCCQCEKSFKSRGNLANHMYIHTGNRPHSCPQCGKSFALKGSLTKHIRIHTGERPYKCNQCGKSFARSCSLSKHMKIHKRKQPN